MNNTQFNSVIRLRRDNDFNYNKIKNKFIPQNGEICLVDTANAGLRAVCGDGITPFGQLEYVGDLLQLGYFKEGAFYKDSQKTIKLVGQINKIYIDLPTGSLYYFDETNFIKISGTISAASSTNAGIMKLYDKVGQNTDGTMTQKAITDELDDKVEIALNHDEEMLLFII